MNEFETNEELKERVNNKISWLLFAANVFLIGAIIFGLNTIKGYNGSGEMAIAIGVMCSLLKTAVYGLIKEE